MALETIGADSAASEGTLVTASVTPGSFGAYVELSSSTGQTCERITVCARNINTTIGYAKIALATGAASSEVDFLEFPIPFSNGEGSIQVSFETAFTIASGTRISARNTSSISAGKVEVTATISDDSAFGTSTENELIGAGTTALTAVDPGGSANTKGSWVELSSSTGIDYDYLIVFIDWNKNAAASTASWLIDIGTGAAASESVLIADIMKSLYIFESPNLYFPVTAPIPSGTRVAARTACNITDATDRIPGIGILGVNLTAPAGGGGGQGISQGLHTINSQISA